ncbi:MAG TPA: sporulation protein YunB, partial [Pseudogracilibacillus sp.]|nr:sporulation protein YunB [Pseudogracilibacillus sp.]
MRFNRFRLKKRHSTPPKQYVFLVTVIIFIIIILFSLWLIDRGIRPALMDIAELKTTEFATRTINSAVKSTEQMNFDDLIEMEMDNNGNVAT